MYRAAGPGTKGSGGNWLETARPNCHLMKISAVWRVSNSSWARTELYICAIPVFTIRWRSESTCPTDTIKQGRSYGNITQLFRRLKISVRTILLRSSGSASWTACSLANDLCQWKCSLTLQLILFFFFLMQPRFTKFICKNMTQNEWRAATPSPSGGLHIDAGLRYFCLGLIFLTWSYVHVLYCL